MRNEEHKKQGRGRGGAQTFRRGRAVMFYQQLEVKRETLKQQLQDETMSSIHPVIAGELKATEGIMAEFRVVFALDDIESSES